ncbi:MAG: methyl-accepting chemotaxis protein [Mariprofundus sp.]|nr:methyl-accepting chemotaxis protein [Mariprofundus sp.]
MRKNLPVTNNEVMMHDGQVIISATDLKGIITEVDQDFLDISGFSRAELIGKNHNIVRHPDMPAPAYKWLWDTIQAGDTWSGYVKNRCKNGDFYWVYANATPIIENGQITGYVSVRTKPDRQGVDAAANLYREINAGRVVLGKTSLLSKLNFFSRMKIWQKLAATLLLVCVLLTATWFTTLQGLNQSNQGLLMAGNDRMVALRAMDIHVDTLDIMVDLKKTQGILDEESFKHSHDYLVEVLADMTDNMDKLRAADLGESEMAALQHYIQASEVYIKHTIKPVIKALGDEEYADFNELVMVLSDGDFKKMERAGTAFRDVQAKVSLQEGAESTRAYEEIRDMSWTLVGGSLLIALISGVLLVLNLRRRLSYTTTKLASIAEGHYFDWVEVDAKDEIGQMLAGLKAMQIRQGYTVQRVEDQGRAAMQIKAALDQSATPTQITDIDYNIFYMNKAAEEMFKNNRDKFSILLDNFNPDNVMGSNIDSYHKDPAHQRTLLNQLRGRYVSADLAFCDDFIVRVSAAPLLGEQGERVGTMVEWINRTKEAQVETEIETMIKQAQAGVLTERVSLKDKEGFFLELSEGFNALLETVEQAVNDTVEGLSALEEGDLTHRIDNQYQGSFDSIKQAANNTAQKLTDIMTEVSQAADDVGTGSAEIAEGNNSLSDRTQEQAAALEETAAAIEEITGTVQQTEDNSRQANQMAADARSQAEQGGVVLAQAVEAMAGINSSSHKISDIIGVIDEIAFQTNLLALNAAVEAARAGDQGRGFAVVAGEVRSLAQRSAAAAKEIKGLINESVVNVEAGSKLVNESGDALSAIVESVRKVGDVIAEIAAASQEQTSGIDQINKAIAQLDSGTQQNTALVEESAAAGHRLSDQAVGLNELVAVFKVS